jgi:hypothetical protein
LETAENILGFRLLKKMEWTLEETWTKIKKWKNIKMMLNWLKTRSKKLKLQEYLVADTEVKKNTGSDTRKWANEQANRTKESVRAYKGIIQHFKKTV